MISKVEPRGSFSQYDITLPAEILCNVFSFLEIRDILEGISLTSRRWRHVSQDEKLVDYLLIKFYPVQAVVNPGRLLILRNLLTTGTLFKRKFYDSKWGSTQVYIDNGSLFYEKLHKEKYFVFSREMDSITNRFFYKAINEQGEINGGYFCVDKGFIYFASCHRGWIDVKQIHAPGEAKKIILPQYKHPSFATKKSCLIQVKGERVFITLLDYIVVHSITSGRYLGRFNPEGHVAWFCVDDQYIAALNHGNQLTVWDWKANEMVMSWSLIREIQDFHIVGWYLFIVYEDGIKKYNLLTGEQLEVTLREGSKIKCSTFCYPFFMTLEDTDDKSIIKLYDAKRLEPIISSQCPDTWKKITLLEEGFLAFFQKKRCHGHHVKFGIVSPEPSRETDDQKGRCVVN